MGAVLLGLIPSVTAGVEKPTRVQAASGYASTVMADNPISYWRLNDTTGTAADQTGNDNGAVRGGVTIGQPGPIAGGKSMSFDGSTGYVDLGTNPNLQPQAFSIEAWFKATSESQACCEGAGRIYRNRWYGQWLDANASGYVTGAMCVSTSTCAAVPVPSHSYLDGQWHYAVFTHSSSTIDQYVDGVHIGSAAMASGTYYEPGGVALARDGNCGCSYYAGSLAEVAVYGYALTADQVTNHFSASGWSIAPPSGPPITAAEVPTGDNFCWRCFAQRTVHGSRAEPVNTATGAFYESFDDLSVPGRGLPVTFTRTYSSARASASGPLGYGWTDGYAMSLSTDSSGDATITGPDGSQTVFTLSGTTYVGPPRAESTLVKNPDGTYTFTQNMRTTYTFNTSGQLTQEKDLNGYVTALAYNASGQLATITDPANRTVTLGYTGSYLSSVTDPLSRKVIYAYDGSGNLSGVTDVNGGITKFTYDTNHLLLTITDARNDVVTTNVYDTSGRVTSQTDGLQRQTTFAYSGAPLSSAGGSTTITDPKGNVTIDQYVNGERTAITRGSGTAQAATWQYRYDPASLGPTLVEDPKGNITRYTYDSNGNRTSVADPLGRTTQFTYDALDDLTTATDPNLVTTTLTYDARGNLLSRSTPLVGSSPAQNQVTTYTYGDTTHPGDVTAVTDPDGKVSHMSYDADGDVASKADPLGDQTTMTYNIVGWITSMVSPRGNATGGAPSQFTTTFSYADPSTGATDEFGDVRVITDPLGDKTTKSYDADRNLVSVQDPDGNLTQYIFDAANEPTDATRADGTKLHTDFFADGTVQDQLNGAGNKTSYTYDPLAHLASVTDPLGNVTSYADDALGDVLSKTDPGGSCTATPKVGCTTYSYDAASQLTSISYSDGTTPNVTGLTYDADGQRTAMTDGTGTSAWVWDSLHRMTSYTNGAGAQVQFGYDLRGLETSITYPGNLVVTDGFDDAGRMTSVKDWLTNTTTFAYDPDSNLTSESLPTTGSVDSFAFDRADRLTNISDFNGGASLFSAAYTRDANGQVTADTSATATQSSYRYTALNQVCYAGASNATACTTPPPASQPFAYDSADNLTDLGSTQQAFNAASELCWTAATTGTCSSPPAGGTTYTYDARGNRTQVSPAGGAGMTLTYDQANRLTAYGSAATYRYNGDGLRMSKTVGTTTTQYLWNLSAGLPLLLQDGSANYVYGPGRMPLEQVSGSTVLYYHHDDLGSTRLLTNSSGATAATYTFDPYGNLMTSSGSAVNPFLYGGQYRDLESGLFYLHSRYYDPTTGQFLSRDPLASITGEPYGYVDDNPLNGTDPAGLDAQPPLAEPSLQGPVDPLQYLSSSSDEPWDPCDVLLASTLPTGGEHPYVSPDKSGKPIRLRGGQGFRDASRNRWVWDPRKGEWDVQHPNGSHTNVGEDGNVTHGDDNFNRFNSPGEDMGYGGLLAGLIGAATVVAGILALPAEGGSYLLRARTAV